ncbi:hypothetical protein GFB49_12865 [Epibacterium sp. SM1979]|uniref:Uncharacterized protein n=1 Tax=Tritonibacter litoralis TaxID=2662264 RepID=A0A843YEL9_9RHOB|nr:hypothetical protein [Tritonibacter litoralis]MQQ09351.1 hypothetical protein [Tritonibacter litoralis]
MFDHRPFPEKLSKRRSMHEAAFSVADCSGDELHELLDRVVVSYDQDAKNHILDIPGNLITMLKQTKPAEEAGIYDAKSSLILVAGVGFEPTTFRL